MGIHFCHFVQAACWGSALGSAGGQKVKAILAGLQMFESCRWAYFSLE